MRVFDEGGRELNTADLRNELARRTDPAGVPIEFHTADGIPITQATIQLPPDIAATVAGVRLVPVQSTPAGGDVEPVGP